MVRAAAAVTPVLAHGLGDASLLPLPLQTVLLIAGASVLVTAWEVDRRAAGTTRRTATAAEPVTVGARAPGGGGPGAAPSRQRTPGPGPTSSDRPDDRPADRPAGRPLLPLTRVVDARATRTLLRVLGLIGGLTLVVLAAVGSGDADANPAPRLLVVVTWAGLIPLSLVAPGAYRALDPVRTLAAGIARMLGDPEQRGVRPVPAGTGSWPAVVPLAVFLGLYAGGALSPTATLLFLVVHAVAQVAAVLVYGGGWLAHAEPFAVTAGLVGRLAPLGRGPEGGVVWGGVRRRLAAPVAPGTVAVVALLIGSSLADFAGDTAWWQRVLFDRPPAVRTLLGVAGLAAGTAVAGALIRVTTRVWDLAPALVPLVTAYGFAHYFAVLLVEGQIAVAQTVTVLTRGLGAVDPATLVADYELLPGTLASSVQLAGFLLLHAVAVVVGRDLAVARRGPRAAARAQLALRAVLAVSAVGGTLLRYSAA